MYVDEVPGVSCGKRMPIKLKRKCYEDSNMGIEMLMGGDNNTGWTSGMARKDYIIIGRV